MRHARWRGRTDPGLAEANAVDLRNRVPRLPHPDRSLLAPWRYLATTPVSRIRQRNRTILAVMLQCGKPQLRHSWRRAQHVARGDRFGAVKYLRRGAS